MLGLPDHVTACLFDLDGVLTQTATVHNAAWTQTFNDFLREHARLTGGQFVPFDPVHDYATYVSGRPRLAGVRAFLASRNIDLPEGSASDPPSAHSVHGLGARKNELLLRLLAERGVEVFPGSLEYLRAARDAGMRRAVVSASANAGMVIDAARIADLIELVIDGAVAAREGLRGKPYPDTFLAAAERLGVSAAQAAVFDDAPAGVEAGRAGGFACVVGVDRTGQAAQLVSHGASIVVKDLADLLPARGKPEQGPLSERGS